MFKRAPAHEIRMPTQRKAPLLHPFFPALSAAAAVMLLGVAVLVGWYGRIPALIQVYPGQVPMQFNTALGFVLAGCGLAALCVNRHRWSIVCGAVVGLLGVATLAEHGFGLDLNIDQALFTHYITVATDHPGRMAPNTALCFILAGLALILAGLEHPDTPHRHAAGVLAALVAGLGAVAFSGYSIQLPTAYGWGNLTRMAIHTALGFVVLGAGLIAAINAKENSRDWLPGVVGVAAATVAIALWQALQARELCAHPMPAPAGMSSSFVLVFGLIMSAALTYAVAATLQARRAALTAGLALARLNAEIQQRQKVQQAADQAERFSHNIADALDNVSAYIYIKDAQCRYQYANRRTLELFRRTPLTLPGCGDGDFFPPQTVERLQAVDRRVLAGEKTGEEIEVHGDDGALAIYWEVKSPLRDDQGRIVGLCGISTDITERKRMERELRLQSEITANAAEGVCLVKAADGSIVYVNRCFNEMFGYAGDELLGKNIAMINAPTDQTPQETAATIIAAVREQGRWSGEVLNVKKDGATFWTYATVSAYQHPEHGTVWVTHQADISQIKLAQQALADSEQRLRLIVQSSPFCVHEIDRQGRLLSMNPAGLTMLGVKRESEVLGKEYLGAVSEYDKSRIAALMQAAFQGESSNFEFTTSGADPSVFRSCFVPIRNGNEQVVRLLGITEDISEQKAAETALLDAMHSAEAANLAKSRFLATMSHELRTPMNGIIGLTQLALEHPLSPTVRDYLEKALSASDSLLHILNDVLDYAKIEAGHMTLESKPFDLGAMLDNLRNLFILNAEEKGLALMVHVAENVPHRLLGDELRIQQILVHLLGNALKFTGQGSVELTVTLKSMDGARALLGFTVSDTGIGMSEEVIANLFQPFTQADASMTRRFGGTGLGLAICHKLLQLLDSRCVVESRPGQGSAFSFDLAMALPAGDTPAATAALAGFDLAMLTEIMEDEDAVFNLLRLFRNDVTATMTQMEACLASGDIAGAERHVHRIKGSAGNVGAQSLHHAGEVLDVELKRGAYLDSSLQAFRSAYQAAMEALKALPEAGSRLPGRPEDFQRLAAELASLLAEKFLIPNELMLKLEAATPPGRLDDYRLVKRYVDNIQYGKALAALQPLLENQAP
ncbi:MAG: PAS domain S-box protein [Methylococcaceae bacterium]|nr:MAG: PAS domain S-box protein [Methylococcaceae bacterium]